MLMDGELGADEAELLLGKINNQPEIKQDWLTYHLIGDALRQPDYVTYDMSAAVFERLHVEPTVCMPPCQPALKND